MIRKKGRLDKTYAVYMRHRPWTHQELAPAIISGFEALPKGGDFKPARPIGVITIYEDKSHAFWLSLSEKAERLSAGNL